MLYNVPDLVPFAALDATAASRVVVEITDRHPLVWMNDLWRDLHGVTFPDGPAGRTTPRRDRRRPGLPVHREDRPPIPRGAAGSPSARTDAFVRRRLCLDPSRDGEVEHLLGDRLREQDGLWSAGPPDGTPVTTMWWDVDAQAQPLRQASVAVATDS